MHNSRAMTKSLALLALFGLGTACVPGGMPGGGLTSSVLGPGAMLPPVSAGGWLNAAGFDASQLHGQVLVIDVFASW